MSDPIRAAAEAISAKLRQCGGAVCSNSIESILREHLAGVIRDHLAMEALRAGKCHGVECTGREPSRFAAWRWDHPEVDFDEPAEAILAAARAADAEPKRKDAR